MARPRTRDPAISLDDHTRWRPHAEPDPHPRSWLLTAEGPSDIILHPTVLTAAEHVRDGYVLSGERIRTGTSAMDAATLQPANADQIAALNRFLQMEIERDRAENGGDGLVLVDHERAPPRPTPGWPPTSPNRIPTRCSGAPMAPSR